MKTCRVVKRMVAAVTVALAVWVLFFVVTPVAGQTCGEQWLPGPNSEIPGVDGPVLAAAEWDPDGEGPQLAQLIVGGRIVLAGGVRAQNIARWDPGDNAWFSLGSGSVDTVFAIISWDRDGPGDALPQLVAEGKFTILGQPDFGVARWNPDADEGEGQWQPMGTKLTGAADFAVWEQGDEEHPERVLVAAGFMLGGSGEVLRVVARWDPTANAGVGEWLAVGQPFNNSISSIEVWNPGTTIAQSQLVAGGYFTRAGDVVVNKISHWDPTANSGAGAWLPFGTGMNDDVRAVCTWDPDGNGPIPSNVVAVGEFESAGGVAAQRVARWDPSANSGSGAWFPFGAGIVGFARDVYEVVTWDVDGPGPAQPEVVVGTRFTSIDLGDNLAHWVVTESGGEWVYFPPGIDRVISAMTTWDPDGDGGLPERLVVGGQTYDAGDVVAFNVAYLEPDQRSTEPVWRSFGTGTDRVISVVSAWNSSDDIAEPPSIVVAGAFSFDGPSATYVAIGNVGNEIGTNPWLPLGGPVDGTVYELEPWRPDGATGREYIVVGGAFETIGETTVNHIAQWDALAKGGQGDWRTLGGGIDATVTSIVVQQSTVPGEPENSLVVGGYFQHARGFPIWGVARWVPRINGDGDWEPVGALGESYVYAVALWDPDGDGPAATSVVAAGNLTIPGRTSFVKVAEWNPQTGWRPLGSGFQSPYVDLVAWDQDGSGPIPQVLVAAGSFLPPGGYEDLHVVRWDPFANGGTGAWVLFPYAPGITNIIFSWNSDSNHRSADRLIASGIYGGGSTRRSVFEWNPLADAGAGAWSELAPGLGGGSYYSSPYSFTAWDADNEGRFPSRLVIGGLFSLSGEHISPNLALFGRPDCLCPGDADGDLAINFADITSILTHWGAEYLGSTGLGDTTGDGIVDFADIADVLAHFNSSCQ